MIDEVSVIIPVFNEEKNLRLLTERLVDSLKGYNFEMIFIDDRSSDGSIKVLSELSKKYSGLKFYKKRGKKGKAFSILEGLNKTRFENIAMLDGDLQYPPESIPGMLEKMEKGADIVVAERRESQSSFLRKLASKIFAYFFVRLIHNLDIDAQSGLKVFKKEIFERVSIDPTPWTFDLEFLIKAREAGYKIESSNIFFYERNAGESKINIINSSIEIGLAAFKLKFFKPVPIPFTS